MPRDTNPDCPNCGEELEDIISYRRGHKTSDGYRCESCDEWWDWFEWEEQT